MKWKHWRLLVRAGQVGFVIYAALIARAHPVIAASLVVLVSATFALSFFASRGHEALVVAVERCDADGIERIAKENMSQRFAALLMLAVVGGVARARAYGRMFCTCGECELHALELELQCACDALALIEAGDTRAAWDFLDEQVVGEPELSPTYVHMRALWAYVGLLAGEEHILAISDDLEKGFTLMRWPIVVATANAQAAKGELAASHAKLERLPVAWRQWSTERSRRLMTKSESSPSSP